MSTGPSAATPGEVADRLHAAAVRLLRLLREQDRAAGVGPARLSALSVLTYGGPCTLGELARAEQVSPATISRVVRGMESGGLARRLPDRSDRRVTRVEATPRGRRELEKARQRRLEELAALLEPLGGEDLAALAAAAGVLRGLLDRRVRPRP
ncbi:MAG: MarR family transcriptional regulator [Acidobacteriota bacterium]|jgi:DNA-binding MarR family transcriptional regulator